MLGILKSAATTIRAALRKPVTVQYPTEKKDLPHRSRGLPVLLWDFDITEPFCTGCQVCARYCPVDCMTVTMKDNPNFAAGKSKRKKIVDKFYIDYARCMRCDICVEVCNFDAIVMNNTWKGHELSRYDRQELVMDLPALLRQSKVGELEDPFREPMGVAHSGWAPKMDEEAEAAAEAASLTRHHGESPDKPGSPEPTPDPTTEAPAGSEASAKKAAPAAEAKAENANPESPAGQAQIASDTTSEQAEPEAAEGTDSEAAPKEGGEA